jgi:hypothetical protein
MALIPLNAKAPAGIAALTFAAVAVLSVSIPVTSAAYNHAE